MNAILDKISGEYPAKVTHTQIINQKYWIGNSKPMSTTPTLSSPITQDEINNILWKAGDTFRGTVDPSQ